MQKCNQSGMTLFELALILFLAIMIMGAVLIGKTIIEVSILRSASGKFTEYEMSFNTFKLKYNALPGDFNQRDVLSNVPRNHLGNGNGEVSGINETFFIWEHLSKANLIGGDFDGNAVKSSVTDSYNCNPDVTCPTTTFNNHTAHLMGSIKNLWGSKVYNSDLVKSPQQIAVFIVNIFGLTGGPRGQLPVSRAAALDQKVDDGKADTGRLLTINDVYNSRRCVTGDITVMNGTVNYDTSASSSSCLVAYGLH